MEGNRCRRGPDLCRMTGEDPLMIENEGIGEIRVSKNSNYWYRDKTLVGVFGTPFFERSFVRESLTYLP